MFALIVTGCFCYYKYKTNVLYIQMFYIIFLYYIYRMKLKEFLDNNPIINSAQLAAKMWPDNKSARSKLTNKLNENIVGSGKQRITDDDMQRAVKALKELSDEINKLHI